MILLTRDLHLALRVNAVNALVAHAQMQSCILQFIIRSSRFVSRI